MWLRRGWPDERLIVFQIQCLHDTSQQARAGEYLQLSIEVRGIVYRIDDHGRGLLCVHRIVFEIDLHPRRGFINVGLACDVDDRQCRHHHRHTNDEPEPLADRAPIIKQMNFAVAGIRTVAITAIWARFVDATLGRPRFILLDQFGSLVHNVWQRGKSKGLSLIRILFRRRTCPPLHDRRTSAASKRYLS